jgi:hypothetical protein
MSELKKQQLLGERSDISLQIKNLRLRQTQIKNELNKLSIIPEEDGEALIEMMRSDMYENYLSDAKDLAYDAADALFEFTSYDDAFNDALELEFDCDLVKKIEATVAAHKLLTGGHT